MFGFRGLFEGLKLLFGFKVLGLKFRAHETHVSIRVFIMVFRFHGWGLRNS